MKKILAYIATIVIRTLGFTPFLMLVTFSALRYIFLYMKNFVLYGGEAITYTKNSQPRSIKDVYDLIENKYEDELRDKG